MIAHCDTGGEAGGKVRIEIEAKECPICGAPVECTSYEDIRVARVGLWCKCGLRFIGPQFDIYYHCLCEEFTRQCEQLITRWNKRI